MLVFRSVYVYRMHSVPKKYRDCVVVAWGNVVSCNAHHPNVRWQQWEATGSSGSTVGRSEWRLKNTISAQWKMEFASSLWEDLKAPELQIQCWSPLYTSRSDGGQRKWPWANLSLEAYNLQAGIVARPLVYGQNPSVTLVATGFQVRRT